MNQISRDGRLRGFSGVPLAASYGQFQADAFRSVFQHMQETSRLIMIYQNQWVSYVCDMNLNDDMDMTDMTWCKKPTGHEPRYKS